MQFAETHPSRRGQEAAPQDEAVASSGHDEKEKAGAWMRLRDDLPNPHGEERGNAARLRTMLRIAG
jgi:hypothetical protein